MKRMIHFEIRKLLDRKIIIALAVLLAVNIGYIFLSHYRTIDDDFYHGKKEIIKNVEGRITQEKVDFLSTGLKKNRDLVESGNFDTEHKDPSTYTGYVYGDMNAFEEVYNDVKRVYDYQDMIKAKMVIIDENIERSGSTNQFSLFLKDRLENRKLSSYYDTQGAEAYLGYSQSFVFMIIVNINGVVNYLYYDRNYEMHMLVQITRNGRNKLKLVRYLVMTGFAFVTALLFTACDCLCFHFIYGIDGLTNPVYSLPAYSMSYFEMPLYAFMIVSACIKMILVLIIVSLIVCLAKKIRSGYITIVLSFAASLMIWQNLCVDHDGTLSIIHMLKTFSVHEIFSSYIHDIFIFVLVSMLTLIGLFYLSVRKERYHHD